MKKILITNDDGYESLGLHALVKAMKPLGQVTVVAPSLEKSACGHSLTLTRPLRFISIDDDFYKLDDGTPTDCIFLALHKLYEENERPDIVISGINKGANMGEDITYSGTASAAMEAVLQGIPAIAISQVCAGQCENIDTLGYDLAVETITALVRRVLTEGSPLPERKFLNVNIPPIHSSDCKGLRITRTGNRYYGNDAHVHRNPRGLEYYWIGLPHLDWLPTEGHITDFEAIKQNYVSITPVHLDMTSHDDIEALESWL